MRILVRTSRWAVWSRRLASFALPLAIVPVFMHRSAMIASETFAVLEGIAIVAALGAFFVALAAFVRLWITGDRGWVRAVTAVIVSALVLGPVGYGVYAYLKYPPVADVSTDLVNPPLLVSDVPRRPITIELARRIIAAFPNVASRTYPLGPDRVFELAADLATARGWEIDAQQPPAGPLGEGQLNAIVITLLGWRDEVSLRINGIAEGSTVAMRSASLVGFHDLGGNGQRVEEFLTALDTEVTVIMRDAPVTAPVEDVPPEGDDPG